MPNEYKSIPTLCAACGKEVPKTITVSSVFGGYSIGLCEKCIAEMREPYGYMVTDIAWTTTGWPDGVNETFQKEVRRQLKLHNKTEEEFKKDLEETLRAFEESQIPDGSDDKYDDFEGDWF